MSGPIHGVITARVAVIHRGAGVIWQDNSTPVEPWLTGTSPVMTISASLTLEKPHSTSLTRLQCNTCGNDKISKPSVSQHLSILEAAGLVRSEKRGQFVHYSLVRESLTNTLNGYVQEVCPVSRPLKKESKALARSRRE